MQIADEVLPDVGVCGRAHPDPFGRVVQQPPDGRPEPDSFQTLLSDDSLFTQSAIETLRRSKFRPARRHGQPVRRRVFQVITFRWK